MLPQEVKEMGAQRQIIFAENVRPILCHKIRYYLRPVFLRRLRPPPTVPTVKPITPASLLGPASPQASPTPSIETRATATEDSDIDLDKPVVPKKADGERLTIEELDTAVESFISAFKQR